MKRPKVHHRDMAISLWFVSWAMALVGGILFSVFENIRTDIGIYWRSLPLPLWDTVT